MTNAAVSVNGTDGKSYTVTVKNDGLYFTDQLPEGKYTVTIIANSIAYTATVNLRNPHAKAKTRETFYNFKLADDKAILSTSGEDPFMETALNVVESSPILFDYPSKSFHAKDPDFEMMPASDNDMQVFHIQVKVNDPLRSHFTKVKADSTMAPSFMTFLFRN